MTLAETQQTILSVGSGDETSSSLSWSCVISTVWAKKKKKNPLFSAAQLRWTEDRAPLKQQHWELSHFLSCTSSKPNSSWVDLREFGHDPSPCSSPAESQVTPERMFCPLMVWQTLQAGHPSTACTMAVSYKVISVSWHCWFNEMGTGGKSRGSAAAGIWQTALVGTKSLPGRGKPKAGSLESLNLK